LAVLEPALDRHVLFSAIIVLELVKENAVEDEGSVATV
jgi:hypothetical protein